MTLTPIYILELKEPKGHNDINRIYSYRALPCTYMVLCLNTSGRKPRNCDNGYLKERGTGYLGDRDTNETYFSFGDTHRF